MPDYTYLIVGGGMTGDAAAQGIREADARGTIGVIGAEPHPPYNRPPLSKALWKGESEDTIWRKTTATGAALMFGRRVVALDLAGRTATDDGGAVHRFQKLLLATGGAPRRLRLASDQVIYFRTLDDYHRLRTLAAQRERFVVIGGGFIGSEVAAALRMQGRDVTMVVPEAGPGALVFPADLTTFLVAYYREKGVTLRLGEGVSGVDSRGEASIVRTTTGGELTVDVAVAGLGILPAVELAERTGLKVENGIVVDEFCRTTHPDVYAAGDVANFRNPALGTRLRVEHEDNANTMGRVAGLNMAGRSTRYDHLPFFYSDLFELGYEAVGELDARSETVADWKEQFREGVVYYLKAGRVRGVLLWNTWGQVDHARRLIAEPGPFRASDLKGRLPA
ncbi:MAG TPA: FAD/NAD(P)-binding oxidoreductase [Gemmatimonadales bacterium]|nr:FAD/NAD(P)-binding oxidoreductase [Gemmatimonadales bacterium]